MASAEVLVGDVVITGLAAERVGAPQDLGLAHAFGGVELVAGQLQAQAVRVAEVDRIHEAAIERLEGNAAGLESLGHLGLCGPRHREARCARGGRCRGMRAGVVLALLVGEHGDEPAVAGIEVEVVLLGPPEVRLLEDESHPEQALPEIDRALAIRPHQSDVMDSLHLDSRHGFTPGVVRNLESHMIGRRQDSTLERC